MKYLITVAYELDGHAGASAVVLDNESVLEGYLRNLEREGYEETHRYEHANETTIYYHDRDDYGACSVKISKFSSYATMKNKEMFTRTG